MYAVKKLVAGELSLMGICKRESDFKVVINYPVSFWNSAGWAVILQSVYQVGALNAWTT